ncbi:MAG: substrate-binding domain-containing protein [Chthoniobacterales bacterium]
MIFRNHFVSISTWLVFAGVVLAGLRGFASGEDAKKSPRTELTIAAAADLKFALDDLVKEFEEKYPATKVNVTYGSSGNFFAQFKNGAPFVRSQWPIQSTLLMVAQQWRR